jgi:para-nitrobenzyl esterase
VLLLFFPLTQKHDACRGVFGFLGSKELSARTDGYGSGNFGIQDQRMAMEWTSMNIDRFGGDKSRLMIHGCSAGGVSISNHLTQPLSWPFFTAAAMESGNMYAFTDAVSMVDAQTAYADLLGGLRCDSIDCLLAKNTTELLRAYAGHAAPVVDGVNLEDFPKALLRGGRVKDVPTVVGAARDELAGLDARRLAPYAKLTADGFRRWLSLQYGPEHVETMLKLYPASSARVGPEGGPCPGDPPWSKRCTPYYYLLETIATDDALVCSARAVAELSPAGKTYQYLFAFPNDVNHFGNGTTTNFVGHCTQNPYVFGNTVLTGAKGQASLEMGALLSERWANLAKYGNPNGGAAADAAGPWAAYSEAADEAFVFGNTAATSAMRPNKKAQCDFLRWCRGNNSGHSSIGAPGQQGQPCTPSA